MVLRPEKIKVKKRLITRYAGLGIIILSLFFLTDMMPHIIERVFHVLLLFFGAWLFMVYAIKSDVI